ncbi:MAG: cobaltochelatase subunit CobN [Verrucomicrobiota bacterium]
MKFCASLLLWLGCLFATHAAEIKVALLIGDAQSAAAIGAITELRRDPALTNVTVRVYPRIELTDADRRFVRESDIIVGFTRYGALLRELAPELRAASERGAWLAGVGTTTDQEYADLGFKRDAELAAYLDAGGQANLVQLVRTALARRLKSGLKVLPPAPFPEFGFFDPASRRAFVQVDDYAKTYLASKTNSANRPWVGIYFSRDNATSGQTELLSALDAAMQARGFNVLFGFGYPSDVALPKLFLDSNGRSRFETLVGLTLKIGNVPDKLTPLLTQLDVPVLNAIALNSQSRTEWEQSASGLEFIERSWQVGAAELAGAVAPTIVASKEKLVDVATSQTYVMTMPITERVERLADRVQAFVGLRHESPTNKHVAVIYYNYPPGKASIGASYLNVLPQSLLQILNRLRADGYNTTGAPTNSDDLFTTIRTFGNNPLPGTNRLADLDQLARSGRVPLLPVSEYRQWFDQLPASLRMQVLLKWGEPEFSNVMVWRDADRNAFFVLPILRWGNVLFGAQPTRGWDQDIEAVYHDVKLPPHHQYLAFYLWLQKNFKADAMIHVGTHATHEWLPGKEVGFTDADSGEVIVGAVPQFYPFIVDDVGEGLQAKRRAMAAIITHLPPPLDRATLSPELRAINGIINDYHVAKEKGSLAGDELRRDLAQRCAKHGLLQDLSITNPPGVLLDEEQIEEIEHHLKKIGERMTPFGMHTFGVAPNETQRAATADAILSLEPNLSPEEYTKRKTDLMARIEASGRAELDALSAGLAGRYIPAGPGNDPIRNPEALPTGKNFYGFDPARLPSIATFAAGSRMAADLIESYRKRHEGQFPDRLVFNLWGTETSRHEGVMEAQILALMGVRPKWDARGRVQGVELISRAELGRPRVDVTVIPSGLYRDLFPVLMQLIDQAVNLVKTDTSADNPLLQNIATARAELEAQGIAPADAERLASVRLFSVPSGVYGTGLEQAIHHPDTWNDKHDVPTVYFNRMSHLFGQGFWGTRARGGTNGDLSPTVLKLALKGAKGVIHSRSSNVYGAVDSDDFYQYLGGTAMAVRTVNGKSADTLVADLSNPKSGETMTLERYMGREMRARYLNPKWIEAMLKEGYAGARMIRQVTDNLWGWQVTVPEAVGDAKWQEMFEVYVQDRNHLDIREKFKAAENLASYKMMVDRMLTVVEKGYWKPTPETLAELRKAQSDLGPAEAAENATIAKRAELQPAPGPAPAPIVNPASPVSAESPPIVVNGRVLEEKPQTHSRRTATTSWSPQMLCIGLAAIALMMLGWWRTGSAQSSHESPSQSNATTPDAP